MADRRKAKKMMTDKEMQSMMGHSMAEHKEMMPKPKRAKKTKR